MIGKTWSKSLKWGMFALASSFFSVFFVFFGIVDAQSEPVGMVTVIQSSSGFAPVVDAPSDTARVINEQTQGDILPFFKQSNGWYRIESGWIHKQYTKRLDNVSVINSTTNFEITSKDSIPVTVLDSSLGYVRLREAPTTHSSHIGNVYPGDTLDAFDKTKEWYNVMTFDGEVGWVSGTYLSEQAHHSLDIFNPEPTITEKVINKVRSLLPFVDGEGESSGEGEVSLFSEKEALIKVHDDIPVQSQHGVKIKLSEKETGHDNGSLLTSQEAFSSLLDVTTQSEDIEEVIENVYINDNINDNIPVSASEIKKPLIESIAQAGKNGELIGNEMVLDSVKSLVEEIDDEAFTIKEQIESADSTDEIEEQKTGEVEGDEDTKKPLISIQLSDHESLEKELDTDDYSFTAGSVDLHINPKTSLPPGLYSATITLWNPITQEEETTSQDFLWGVFALNTDKDTYQQGDSGTIDIGVLDDKGIPVCDAHLAIEVTTPEGEVDLLTSDDTIENTGVCETFIVGNTKPDYTTTYTWKEAGTYTLKTTALIENGIRSMTTTINVHEKQKAPSIKRTSATRNFPEGKTTMELDITAVEDFQGSITEQVPKHFSIDDIKPSADVEKNDENQTIRWDDVSIDEGETLTLTYSYDAPDISPAFYTLGPLVMESQKSEHIENRVWMIANDVMHVWEPFERELTPNEERIYEKIKTHGSLDVIISLDVPGVDYSDKKTTSKTSYTNKVKKSRKAIKEKQDKIKHAVRQRQQTVSTTDYSELPLLTMDIEEEGFRALIEQNDVTAIQENKLHKKSLDSALPVANVDDVHTLGFDGTGYAIAILDTEIEQSHGFIDVISEACYSSSGTSICPSSAPSEIGTGSASGCTGVTTAANCSHGTHVSGIAAGTGGGGAGAGVLGVAKGADIIGISVFHWDGADVLASDADIISGLNRVLTLHNDVTFTTPIAAVNMSLGGGSESNQTTCDLNNFVTKIAIDFLRAVDIPTFIASGNESVVNGIGEPSCISTAFAVGSTSDADVVSSFSNAHSMLDYLAPGESITSSDIGGTFITYQGTSMATPYVSGAYTVLKSAFPSKSLDDITSALTTTGVSVTDTRPGAGSLVKPRIDLLAAYNALDSTSPGAVSSNLNIWFKADAGTSTTTNGSDVNTWSDQSGNSMDATKLACCTTPDYNDGSTNGLANFNPFLDFTPTAYYQLPNGVLSSTGDYTIYHASHYGNPAAIKGLLTGGNNSTNNKFEIGHRALGRLTDDWWFNDLSSTPVAGTSPMNIATHSYDNTSGRTIHSNGKLVGSNTSTARNTPDQNWRIGDIHSPQFTHTWQGYLSELIVYKDTIHDAASRNRVESYLALKYGVSLDQSTAQDYTASNGTTEMWDKDQADASTYDYDIFGVGQDSGSDLGQVKSRSVNADAIVTIEAVGEGTNAAPTFVDIADLEFLMIGNNDGAALWTDTGAPAGYEILTRVWSVQELNGDIGTINLDVNVADTQFNVPALTSGTDYFFVRDSDNDGDLSDETPSTMTDEGGNIWGVDGIDFQHGEEFTVATQSYSANATLAVTTSADETGPTDAIFTVTLDNANTTGSAITFDTTLADITATGGGGTSGDYDTNDDGVGTLSVANGASTGTISIDITNDNRFENDETFSLTISNPSHSGVTITIDSATDTITDNDDPTATLTVTTSGSESGPTDTVFTVTLNKTVGIGSAITFDTTLADITATGGSGTSGDYDTDDDGVATISIADGASSGTITIDITDDSLTEGDETYSLTISNPSNGDVTIGTATAIDTITDNDTFSANASVAVSTSASETGPTDAVFTVTLDSTNTSGSTITFDTTLADVTATGASGTAGDYDTDDDGAGTVSIANGATTGTITIDITDDALFENDETFSLTISNPSDGGVTITTASATDTITDNDNTAGSVSADLTITTNGAESGPTDAVFTVTLGVTNNTGSAITFDTTLADILATGASGTSGDYDTDDDGTATLSVADGASTGTITIDVNDDALFENDETFSLTISNASDAAIGIGTATATGTIIDDDNTAGSINADLTVSTNGDETGPVDIVYTLTLAVTNNTHNAITFDTSLLGGTGTAGSDFNDNSGTANFSVADGQSTGTFTVQVVNDSDLESTETVLMTVSNASDPAININTASASANITDNDGAGTFAAITKTTDGSETGPVDIVFTVTLSTTNATGSAITFDTAISGGTAGSDYTDTSGAATVSIANGASTGTFTIPVIDDADVESTETITVTISNPSLGTLTISTSSASATITDNDTADSDGDGTSDDDEDWNVDGDTNPATNPGPDCDVDGNPAYLDADEIAPGTCDLDSDGTVDFSDTDIDGDGLLNSAEDLNSDGNYFNDDADGDGIPAFLDPNDAAASANGGDSDGDGITDATECPSGYPCNDQDKDGTPDYMDTDSDGDGLLDSIEGGTVDTDGDGTLNFRDTDSDGDGIPDSSSAPENNTTDADGDGIVAYLDPDDHIAQTTVVIVKEEDGDDVVLKRPRDVTVNCSQTQATLRWKDKSQDENVYEVERTGGGESWQLIATLKKDTETYTDPGLAPGVVYSWKVRTTEGNDESRYSDVVACRTSGGVSQPQSSELQTTPPETTQTQLPACSDAIDNDQDGKVDFPDDPGCTSSNDPDEQDNEPVVINPICSDGIDNDNDGKTDYPNDEGCDNALDQTEESQIIIDQTAVDVETLVETAAEIDECVGPRSSLWTVGVLTFSGLVFILYFFLRKFPKVLIGIYIPLTAAGIASWHAEDICSDAGWVPYTIIGIVVLSIILVRPWSRNAAGSSFKPTYR